jgi:hypothetical protein
LKSCSKNDSSAVERKKEKKKLKKIRFSHQVRADGSFHMSGDKYQRAFDYNTGLCMYLWWNQKFMPAFRGKS